MKRVPWVALLIAGMALPAIAGPQDFTSRIGRHRESRTFWLSDDFPGRAAKLDLGTAQDPSQKFTKTYVEGIARRFAPSGSTLDLFGSHRLGEGGPAITGTVDGGAAKLVLRWNTGE